MDTAKLVRYITNPKHQFGADVQAMIEAQSVAPVLNYRNVLVLSEWVVLPDGLFGNSFRLIHTTQLVWLYGKETKHSINFIPVGTSHGIVLCYHDALGKAYRSGIDTTNKAIQEELLSTIWGRAPWAIAGWDDYLSKSWRDRPIELFRAKEGRLSTLIHATPEKSDEK